MQRNRRRRPQAPQNITTSIPMAASFSSSSAGDAKLDLVRKIKTHEVAIVELNNLSSSRAVYQSNGNIFFRSSVQKATAAEQKHLDSAKAKLEKVNAS